MVTGVVALVLSACGLTTPVLPPTPAPGLGLDETVRQLEELDGVTASSEIHDVVIYEQQTVTATVDHLTLDLVMEISTLTRAGLALEDTGVSTRLQIFSAGQLYYEAVGLQRMNDYITDDIRYLFAVNEVSGDEFRLLSQEGPEGVEVARTLETISTDYSPTLNWANVALVPDRSGNDQSIWHGPGLYVYGEIPTSFIYLMDELSQIGNLVFDDFDAGGIQLMLDEGGEQFVTVSAPDVGSAYDLPLEHDQTEAWPLVLEVLAVVNGRVSANVVYVSGIDSGSATVHIGTCDFVWSDSDFDSDTPFFDALVRAGAALPADAGAGECGVEE